jgi:hypothetical protein
MPDRVILKVAWAWLDGFDCAAEEMQTDMVERMALGSASISTWRAGVTGKGSSDGFGRSTRCA